MKSRLRLTSRIVLIFVLFAAVLLLGVGLLSFASGHKAMRTAAVAETLSIALEKEAQIQSWYDEELAKIGELADSLGSSNQVRRALEGQDYARHNLHRQLLPYVTRYHSSYLELSVLNPRGEVLVSTAPERVGTSDAGRPYFEKGKRIQFLDGPRYDAASGGPVLTIASPIQEQGGDLIGMLVAHINLTPLTKIINRRTGLRETDETILINVTGHAVVPPRLMRDPKMMENPLDGEGIRRCLQRNSGVVFAPDYQGVPALTVYRWLSTRDLGLIVKIRQSEAFAPSRRFAITVSVISILALVAASGIAYWLAHGITRPLRRLQDKVSRFARGEAITPDTHDFPRDEVGLLNHEFTEMAEVISNKESQLRANSAELQAANTDLQAEMAERRRKEVEIDRINKQLVETSRQAGMAEVATSVLHNVGNVLNSVNVTTTLVNDGIRKSKAVNIRKVAALLQEHEADLPRFLTEDSRGRQLPGYLKTLANHLQQEQEYMLENMRNLQKNVEHIKDIVAMQQSHAKVYGVTEILPPADLVEDALHLNAGALVRHEVEVFRDYADVPEVSVERHKVLQILVNLIRNAKYACDEGAPAQKWIRLQIREEGGFVLISVIDNGIGIPPENMQRIYAHGFTTREKGHGFGLHNSALVARQLGGALTAYSAGTGTGATFTLSIPVSVSEKE